MISIIVEEFFETYGGSPNNSKQEKLERSDKTLI